MALKFKVLPIKKVISSKICSPLASMTSSGKWVIGTFNKWKLSHFVASAREEERRRRSFDDFEEGREVELMV